MRFSLTFLLAALLCNYISTAQEISTAHKNRMIAYAQMPDVEKTETVQSRFREQQWSPAHVQLAGGRMMAVPLIFDQFNNHLYYLQGAQIMEFQQRVTAFSMDLIERNDTIQLHFRNGYPAVGKNTGDTYYEVMVDGPVQLLRCKAKTIYLQKEIELPEDRRDYRREVLYVYSPETGMVAIQRDKEDLLKKLEPHAAALNGIMQKHKIQLKKDRGLQELFYRLNDVLATK